MSDGALCIDLRDLVIRYGDVVAVNGVSFEVGRGEHVTLLGPSGCGKTTTLRAIAGLEQPVAGTISIDAEVMYDAVKRRNVPTEQRGVSMVFQSYAVWPHMTVLGNVAYGLKVRKESSADIRAKVERALDLVQMRHLADRPASKLSGGQQQRVALARAIAFSPTVVLFDEPLSNLDAKLRAEMRLELRELQRQLGITSVYVTHDQEEALAISDRVIVMNVGVIEQIGTPEQIYNRPTQPLCCRLCRLRQPDTRSRPRGLQRRRRRWNSSPKAGTCCKRRRLTPCAATRPRWPCARPISRSAKPIVLNQMPGTVRRRMFHGDFVQYVVDCPLGQMIVRHPPTNLVPEGEGVNLSFSPEHCVLLEG